MHICLLIHTNTCMHAFTHAHEHTNTPAHKHSHTQTDTCMNRNTINTKIGPLALHLQHIVKNEDTGLDTHTSDFTTPKPYDHARTNRKHHYRCKNLRYSQVCCDVRPVTNKYLTFQCCDGITASLNI